MRVIAQNLPPESTTVGKVSKAKIDYLHILMYSHYVLLYFLFNCHAIMPELFLTGHDPESRMCHD